MRADEPRFEGEGPRVPQLYVEQLALGELDAGRARQIREQLEAEPGGLERLAAIEADNAATLEALPAGMVAAQIEGRLGAARAKEKRGSKRSPWIVWGAPLLTATTAALIALTLGGQPNGQSPMLSTPKPYTEPTERTKGGPKPHLLMSLKRGDRGEHITEGAEVRPGDVVQVGYMAVGAKFGAIVSIDGRGTVTWHLPAVGRGGAAVLAPKGERWLSDSYELDDAPSFERFFLVTSDRFFDVEAVDRAAEALAMDIPQAANGTLKLPQGLAQNALLLNKSPSAKAAGEAHP